MRFKKEPDSQLSEGVWTQEYDGATFLISHWSHLPFQRAVQRLQAPHAKKIQAGRLDPKTSRDIVSRAMADELVHNWKGVVDDTGKPVPFDPESCFLQLNNDPGLRDFLAEFSMDQDNFRVEVKIEAGKSSPTGSDGGMIGAQSSQS